MTWSDEELQQGLRTAVGMAAAMDDDDMAATFDLFDRAEDKGLVAMLLAGLASWANRQHAASSGKSSADLLAEWSAEAMKPR